MRSASSCLLLFLLLASCERDIQFDLDSTEQKLVVEGTIEEGGEPVVILTRSFDYFSAITPALLTGSFVRGAQITISSGGRTVNLKEYEQRLGPGVSLFYYSTDTLSPGGRMKGTLNTSYDLRIETGGEVYTSTTTIPGYNKIIDSLYYRPAPRTEDSGRVQVMLRATDEPGLGHYVRYFTRRNSEPFLPAFNSTFDDAFIDGTSYEVQVDPGVDRNAERDEEDGWFYRGDTVTLKLSGIDRATYDFWRTMEYSYGSVGNPFSSPVRVISNISNGALGYFGGYAPQYRTVVIPR